MINEVIALINEITARQDGQPKFFHVGSKKIPFDKKFFFPILPSSIRSVAFVDGGNAEIIRAPHLSVHFVRTYAAVYRGVERVARQTREAFAVIHLKPDKASFVYKADIIGVDCSIPEIDINDSVLNAGEQVTPHVVADIVRHCLEWQLLELQDADCVVRDGALDECPQDRYRKAKQAAVMQIGVSKTTTALTDTGVSAPFFLSQKGPEGAWVYCPEQELFSIGFARLHPLSHRVFRMDVKNGTLPETAGILAPYCSDASFVGYPYPLVDADKMAVITTAEQQYLRQVFSVKCGKLFKQLEQASDAHDVLNSLH
ncbi:MAG: hypothetical protein HY363_06260 [Candidatus Aenigmarchaeota archaeon]|nr:hypothetical protein [Candidatus Aenigmarchaeota archaeon]